MNWAMVECCLITNHNVARAFTASSRVAHRHACTSGLQHTDIIKVIAERHDVFHRPALRLNPFVKRLPLLLPPRAIST